MLDYRCMYLRRVLILTVVTLLTLGALGAQEPADKAQPAAAAAAQNQDGGQQAQDADQDQPLRRAVIIQMNGVITPQLEHYIYRALEKAQKQDAEVVVIEIDSPGGYLDSSLQLARRFGEIQWATVLAYIPREALSGAAIAALGCDTIVVGKNARIGDAGPIFFGEDALFRHAPEKLRSDLAQQMRLIAEQSGRPPTLAEAMVDMNLQVFEFKNKTTGEVRYLSQREWSALEQANDWEKVRPIVESGEGRFLEVVGRRAVELELADGLAESREQLATEWRLEQPVRQLRPGFVDGLVYWLNRPLITGLLFVIGLVALYLEVSAPGISVGGLTAGLCFALFFWSRFLGGTAGMLELLLFLAGIVFLAVEIFVLPGFGISGLAGIAMIGSSLILASQDYLIPRTQRELEDSVVGLMVVTGSGFIFLGAAVVLSRHFGRLPILNRLALETPAPDTPVDDTLAKPTSPYVSTSYKVAVGDWGVAESPLRPAGKVIFGDDYVDVVADGTFVEAGQQVKVVRISGNRIVVREIGGGGEEGIRD